MWQDRFTHLTANPQLLLTVANQFYKDSEGDWLLLVLDAKKLKAEVNFLPIADVVGTEHKICRASQETAIYR